SSTWCLPAGCAIAWVTGARIPSGAGWGSAEDCTLAPSPIREAALRRRGVTSVRHCEEALRRSSPVRASNSRLSEARWAHAKTRSMCVARRCPARDSAFALQRLPQVPLINDRFGRNVAQLHNSALANRMGFRALTSALAHGCRSRGAGQQRLALAALAGRAHGAHGEPIEGGRPQAVRMEAALGGGPDQLPGERGVGGAHEHMVHLRTAIALPAETDAALPVGDARGKLL